ELEIDGRVEPGSGVERRLALDPGEHLLVARAGGGPPDRIEITVGRGEERRIELAAPVASAAPELSREPDAPRAPGFGARGWLWTWIAAGVAVAAGGASVATWIAANDAFPSIRDRCVTVGCDDADVAGSSAAALETATNVLWIGAVIAGATAVALFV